MRGRFGCLLGGFWWFLFAVVFVRELAVDVDDLA